MDFVSFCMDTSRLATYKGIRLIPDPKYHSGKKPELECDSDVMTKCAMLVLCTILSKVAIPGLVSYG